MLFRPGFVGIGWCATLVVASSLHAGDKDPRPGPPVPDPLPALVLGADADGDGVVDDEDNCPAAANADQEDLDGDGDADVLAAFGTGSATTETGIAWFENLGGGNFGNLQTITTAVHFGISVYAADLDGDDDVDVLSASVFDGKIAWYSNLGDGSFGPQDVITTSAAGAFSVFAADLDGDDDMDVLSASSSDQKIAWYENLGHRGRSFFGPQQVLTTFAERARSVLATDLDGNGSTDVLVAAAHFIGLFENLGGGAFGSLQIVTNLVEHGQAVLATDLDGDGDPDALSGSWTEIAWYENPGHALFGPQQVIDTIGAESIFAADLDGDGDADVLSVANGPGLAWYENLGFGDFGPRQLFSTGGALFVYATDLDGDGAVDVLTAAAFDQKVAWYRNLADGVGDACDNCPAVANADQADLDDDTIGDVCDPCPLDPTNLDGDGDGFCDDGDGSGTALDAICGPDALPGDPCDDNCPGISNPGQGAAPFGQPVVATGPTRFEWTTPVSWERSRGLFNASDELADYTTNDVRVGSGTDEDDPDEPPPGSAFWYPSGIDRSYWRTIREVGTAPEHHASVIGLGTRSATRPERKRGLVIPTPLTRVATASQSPSGAASSRSQFSTRRNSDGK